jgi:hypothetical protein
MVFDATFNTISVISWRSFLLVEETGIPGENQRPVLKWRYVLIAQVVVNPTAIPSRPPLK